jgi:hypothetical protein
MAYFEPDGKELRKKRIKKGASVLASVLVRQQLLFMVQ